MFLDNTACQVPIQAWTRTQASLTRTVRHSGRYCALNRFRSLAGGRGPRFDHRSPTFATPAGGCHSYQALPLLHLAHITRGNRICARQNTHKGLAAAPMSLCLPSFSACPTTAQVIRWGAQSESCIPVLRPPHRHPCMVQPDKRVPIIPCSCTPCLHVPASFTPAPARGQLLSLPSRRPPRCCRSPP